MKIPECWICMDEGFVFYKDDKGYERILHCTCKAGVKWTYDGRACTKRPSHYYIPSVEVQFDIHDLAKYNLMQWLEKNRDRPGVIEALNARGIKVDKLTA
jgi:hypothetical protein